MPRRPAKRWIRRCIASVEASGSAVNPGAVCGAVWARKSPAQRRAAAKGETKMARRKKKHAKRVCYTVRTTKGGKPSKHGGHKRRVCRRVRKHHK